MFITIKCMRVMLSKFSKINPLKNSNGGAPALDPPMYTGI